MKFIQTMPRAEQLCFKDVVGSSKDARKEWKDANSALFNNLVTLPEDGSIVVPSQCREGDEPKHFLIRLANGVSQQEIQEIEQKFTNSLDTKPKCHEIKEEALHRNLTGEGAWHLGSWERQSNPPMVTRDVCQADTTGGAAGRAKKRMAALEFLATLDKILGKRLKGCLEAYD